MFVPAPPLASNGTTNRYNYVSRTVRSGFLTKEAAIAALSNTNYSTNSVVGRKTRANMQNGVTTNGFRNTPYSAWSIKFEPTGTAYSISYSSLYKRYACAQSNGCTSGSNGAHGTAIGSPWGQFDWETISGRASHIQNRLACNNLRNKIENEAKLKALDMKYDLSETLVDAGTTVGYVASKAATLLRVLVALRRGKIRDAFRYAGLNRLPNSTTVASAWLELQYAIMPLISDIQSAVSLVNTGLSRPDGDIVVTRRGRTSLSIDPYSSATCPLDANGSAQCLVETKYRFRLENAAVDYLSQLGISNPLYTGWVAIPLSFVIDWIIPVGDWLKGITSTIGLEFVSGYTTVKTEVDYTATGPYTYTSSSLYPIIETGGRAGYRLQSLKMRRYPHYSFPTSRLYFQFPFSSNKRIASAIALVEVLTSERRA